MWCRVEKGEIRMNKEIKKLKEEMVGIEKIAEAIMDIHPCSFNNGLIHYKKRYYQIKSQLEGYEFAEKEFKKKIDKFIKRLKEESKHIKICDKLKIKGKEIILTEDLCSRKDVEIFLSKFDKLAGEKLE